jgi:hypothetical protein
MHYFVHYTISFQNSQSLQHKILNRTSPLMGTALLVTLSLVRAFPLHIFTKVKNRSNFHMLCCSMNKFGRPFPESCSPKYYYRFQFL